VALVPHFFLDSTQHDAWFEPFCDLFLVVVVISALFSLALREACLSCLRAVVTPPNFELCVQCAIDSAARERPVNIMFNYAKKID
jgi:hypothetical protein